MADKKITQLTNITGANLVDADEFVVVDISADETKAITLGELKEAFDSGSGFVRTTGDTMTGDLALSGADVTFGDNDKAIFGAGSDLQIYHDGSHSYIRDVGTGLMRLTAQDFLVEGSDGSDIIYGVQGGATTIYHSGAAKLSTTSTGIDVTGTVTADLLTVSQENPKITITDTGTGADHELNGSSSIGNLTLNFDKNDEGSSPYFYIQHAGSKLAAFRKGGDISFYDSLGSSQSFFWNAAAESLGIRTTSTGSAFELNGNGRVLAGNFLQFNRTDNATGAKISNGGAGSGLIFNELNGEGFKFQSNGSDNVVISSSGDLEMTGGGSVGWANWTITESGGSLYFATGGTNKMKLDASGNLQVVGNVESNATIT